MPKFAYQSYLYPLAVDLDRSLDESPLDLKKIEHALDKYGVNEPVDSYYKLTPLVICLLRAYENIDVLKLLISKKANVNSGNTTPLYYALQSALVKNTPGTINAVLYLIKHGADQTVFHFCLDSYQLGLEKNLSLKNLIFELRNLKNASSVKERSRIEAKLSTVYSELNDPETAKEYQYRSLLHKNPHVIAVELTPGELPAFLEFLDKTAQLEEKKESNDATFPTKKDCFYAGLLRSNLRMCSYYELPNTHHRNYDFIQIDELVEKIKNAKSEEAYQRLKDIALNENCINKRVYAAEQLVQLSSIRSVSTRESFWANRVLKEYRDRLTGIVLQEANPQEAIAFYEKILLKTKDNQKTYIYVDIINAITACLNKNKQEELINKAIVYLKSLHALTVTASTSMLLMTNIAKLISFSSDDKSKLYLLRYLVLCKDKKLLKNCLVYLSNELSNPSVEIKKLLNETLKELHVPNETVTKTLSTPEDKKEESKEPIATASTSSTQLPPSLTPVFRTPSAPETSDKVKTSLYPILDATPSVPPALSSSDEKKSLATLVSFFSTPPATTIPIVRATPISIPAPTFTSTKEIVISEVTAERTTRFLEKIIAKNDENKLEALLSLIEIEAEKNNFAKAISLCENLLNTVLGSHPQEVLKYREEINNNLLRLFFITPTEDFPKLHRLKDHFSLTFTAIENTLHHLTPVEGSTLGRRSMP